MSDFWQIPAIFDVSSIAKALSERADLFGIHNQRATSYNSPHAAMSDIWIRYNDFYNFGENFHDEHESVWYPSYKELPSLSTIIFNLMHLVEGERLGGVLITKLAPGGAIAEHVDSGWHADYYEKFYIPIAVEDGAVFSFPSGDIKAQPGECYWFNNAVPHSVKNNSNSDRISLIVCIKTRLFAH